jgi:predicted GNAT superfamily acetyltransferase
MSEACDITYRSIEQICELLEAVELQKMAWPPEMLTSLPQMAAANLHGGSVLGAFSGSSLIGFSYAFPGYDGREAYLASHMMAIHPAQRDRGLGMRLKLEQRLWAIEHGYRKILWTFDPFETRNGYLNLCKLGATVGRYIPAFYGNDVQSLPTDRFLVDWELHSARVGQTLARQEASGRHAEGPENNWETYPSLLEYETEGQDLIAVHLANREESGVAPGYLLPVPANARGLRQAKLALLTEWQSCLRRLCPELFALGYQAVALKRRDGLHHDYVLEVAN